MKIYIRCDHILLISNNLVSTISFLTGFGKNSAMAFAIFPAIIILRDLDHPMTDQWINHEKIHIKQSFESFGLFFVYAQFEYLYARIILKYSRMEAYKYECIEQEAYLNQHNLNYLKERRRYNTYQYINKKIKFEINKEYKVILN